MPYIFLVIFALASNKAVGELLSLQFVATPEVVAYGGLELRTGEDTSVPIEVRPHEISKFYKVPASEHWSVGKFKQAADGTREFVEYGKVKSLQSQHQLVILIPTGDANDKRLNLVVVGNELVRFIGGTFLIVNGSDKEIGGILDDQEVSALPMESCLIQNTFADNKNAFHVQLSYRRDDKMKLFLSRKWPLNKKARALVCFYNDPKSKRLKMHPIRDF